MRGGFEAARGGVGGGLRASFFFDFFLVVQSYKAHKSRTRSHQTMRFVRPDVTTLHKVLRWFLDAYKVLFHLMLISMSDRGQLES